MLLAVPVVALVVAFGVWVTGALVTNDFRLSMALTGLWFGATGLACVVVARRSRRLRWPVLGTYVVTVALIGGYLGLTTVRDRVADETVVSGAALARGDFRAEEHHTEGVASVVEVGRRSATSR